LKMLSLKAILILVQSFRNISIGDSNLFRKKEPMNNGNVLFSEISELIEQSRRAIYAHASGATVLLFWEIGRRVNRDVLENKRADYGKQVVSSLAAQLTEKYGRSFEARNLRRMMQATEQFPDFEIVSQAATQLSWAHFIEILPLKSLEAKLYGNLILQSPEKCRQ